MSDAHTGAGAGPSDTTTYNYNGDDELTSQTSGLSGTTSNGYDPNGSLTTSTAGGVTTTYTYDARNKMIGYTSGSVVAAYVYDDAGNRVRETANGTTTLYLTDTQNPTGYAQPVEQKATPTAAPSVTYTVSMRVVAQADASGTVTYLLPDGHGSTQQLVTATGGTVIAALRYTAFGDAANFTPSTAGTVFLFGGDAVYDPTSGLYLHGNGVRPTNGFEFIQRDALGYSNNQDPLSLHAYLYAAANPIMGMDPSGHMVPVPGLGPADPLLAVTQGEDYELQDAEAGAGAMEQAENVAGQLEGEQAVAAIEEGEVEAASGGPTRINSARVLIRSAEESGPYHNFPESFNEAIFNGMKTVVENFYRVAKPGLTNTTILYRLAGSINGVVGIFEIATRPSVSGTIELIIHRFFQPS